MPEEAKIAERKLSRVATVILQEQRKDSSLTGRLMSETERNLLKDIGVHFVFGADKLHHH